ncbi:MAG: transposase [Bdellovibrionales bacterium]|nr:transposase [Bdellovibrionales bacterium]
MCSTSSSKYHYPFDTSCVREPSIFKKSQSENVGQNDDVRLGYFKKLYDLEEKIGEKPPDERYRLRLEIAEPIWKEMKEWAEGHQPKVPAKARSEGPSATF